MRRRKFPCDGQKAHITLCDLAQVSLLLTDNVNVDLTVDRLRDDPMPKRYLQGIIDESTYNSAWRIISHNLHLYLITALYSAAW